MGHHVVGHGSLLSPDWTPDHAAHASVAPRPAHIAAIPNPPREMHGLRLHPTPDERTDSHAVTKNLGHGTALLALLQRRSVSASIG